MFTGALVFLGIVAAYVALKVGVQAGFELTGRFLVAAVHRVLPGAAALLEQEPALRRFWSALVLIMSLVGVIWLCRELL